ncbi:Protein spinster [Chionoecetes opilio]|uniref:Protein spinster n=1 Tax=Chionoecetes opilio TaxID=41210 RepID=A0A8J8WAM2_CHIOP|nr:Protein spinster [Chionoecetes opilio]
MPPHNIQNRNSVKLTEMEEEGLRANLSHQELIPGGNAAVVVVNPAAPPTPNAQRVTKGQLLIVSVLCYVNLINYMDRFTVAGILYDIQHCFDISDSQAGLLQTAFVLVYMVMAPLFGYLGDRYSRKYLMAVGIFFWSLATLVGSFMPNYGTFLLFRCFVGVGEASYSTIAPTIISDLFVGDTRSKMLALFYFAIPVGRLDFATLKLHVKSRRISRGNHTVFHLEKLKDLTCAHEYAVAVSNRFDVLGALGDPVELWDTFKRETLQAVKECIGERPRSRRGFVSTETLEKIEESRAARLAGNRDQHRALSRRTRTLLRRDKERYVRSLAEDVEGHLNANDLRPAYRALKKLRSKSPSRASAIRTADGRLVSDMDGQMARWAEYFGQLFTVDPPTEQLHTTGLQAVDADPPIDETAPSLTKSERRSKVEGWKGSWCL